MILSRVREKISYDDVNVGVKELLFLGQCFDRVDCNFFFYFFDNWYNYYMEFDVIFVDRVDFFVFWIEYCNFGDVQFIFKWWVY